MMNMRRGGDKMSKKYDELLHTLCIYDSVEKVLKDVFFLRMEKSQMSRKGV